MTRILLCAFLFLAANASAQVRVEWSPEKSAFLVGEPIYLVLRITNTSSLPIGYLEESFEPRFSIAGREPYAWRRGCRLSESVFSGSKSSSHPPTFGPGQTVTFSYLLRGYRLEPGTHSVRADGYLPINAMPDDRRHVGNLNVTVVPGSEDALRKILDALVARATNNLSRDGVLARAGVFESASPAFVDEIAKFATLDGPAPLFPAREGYEALADINTVSARAHLRRLYDEATNLNMRQDIVRALSRLPELDNLEFLKTLLPGRSTPADEAIRMAAIDGLICIGGESAAAAVVSHVAKLSEGDRRFDLLTRTRSKAAVDAVVAMPFPANGDELLQACESLGSLTHFDWCDDERLQDVVFDSTPDGQRKLRDVARSLNVAWVRWWSRNRASVQVFKPDAPRPDRLPRIR